MARKALGFWTGEVSELRSVSGVIAIDNATLTDANIPPASAVDCRGYDTIFVGVEIAGGSSPTMTIEALFRDANAADGSRWKRSFLGAKGGITAIANPIAEDTGALDGTAFAELRVYGHAAVFLRVKAVANAGSTTSYKILGMPGGSRDRLNLNRS